MKYRNLLILLASRGNGWKSKLLFFWLILSLFALGLEPKKEWAGPSPEPTQFAVAKKKEAHSIGACGLACQNAVWLPSAEKEKTDSSRWKENHDPRAMSPLYSSFSFCREPNRHCCAVTVVTCRPFRSRATVQRPSVHVTFSYPGRLLRFGKRPRVQSRTHLAPESFVQDIPLDGKVFP